MPQRSSLKLNLGQLDAKMQAGAVRGLQIAMEHLLQVSREQVPTEETTLERSGTPSVDPASMTGAVSYDTPYAVRQHEELTWQHDDGRKAKYLEDPFGTESAKMQEQIATEIRRALR